jgi:hypothetical protein
MRKYFSTIPKFPISLCRVTALLLFIYSCSAPAIKNEQQNEKRIAAKPPIIKKPASSFGDTLIIDRSSAVFYTPDSMQMIKIKAVNEKATFEMIEHDCFYQMRNARMVIKQYWPKISIIEISKARYLQFMKEDKSNMIIDLNEKNDICGVFLFDKKKNPVLIDMPNVDTELGFYFKK